MNDQQRKVTDFHRLTDNPVGLKPTDIKTDRKALRAALIYEEAAELIEAMGGPPAPEHPPKFDFKKAADLPAVADAIADLQYVVHGTAVEFGIDADPVFDVVHRANMTKGGGPVREDGKALKPDDWTPPDVAGEIAKQQAPTRQAWAVEGWAGYEVEGRRWVETSFFCWVNQPGKPKTFTLLASARDFVRRLEGLEDHGETTWHVVPVIVDEGGNFVARIEPQRK